MIVHSGIYANVGEIIVSPCFEISCFIQCCLLSSENHLTFKKTLACGGIRV